MWQEIVSWSVQLLFVVFGSLGLALLGAAVQQWWHERKRGRLQ